MFTLHYLYVYIQTKKCIFFFFGREAKKKGEGIDYMKTLKKKKF